MEITEYCSFFLSQGFPMCHPAEDNMSFQISEMTLVTVLQYPFCLISHEIQHDNK